MRLSPFHLSLLAGLCVLGGPVSAKGPDKYSNALKRELQLAAREGLPTTVTEFEKYLPPKILGENAATYYNKLLDIRPRSRIPSAMLSDSIYDPRSLVKAKDYLKSCSRQLALLDKASNLPCRFARDWSLGAAILFPELVELKDGAKLILLRGNVAAAEGRFGDAIAASEQVERLCKQIRSEPVLLSQLVTRSISAINWRNLADLAYRYRGQSTLTDALQRSIVSSPPPDLKSMYRFSLIELMSTIELCRTRSGRAKIGFRIEDENAQGVGASMLTYLTRKMPRTQAMSSIVRESRALWQETIHPGPQSFDKNAETEFTLSKSLAKFPYALILTEALGTPQQDPYGVLLSDRARRLAYRGVLRALRQPMIPSSLDTTDLRSPIDSSPMQYSFDGERLEIAIRESGGEENRFFRLSFPPKPKPSPK